MEPLLLAQLRNAGGSSRLIRFSIVEPSPMHLQEDNTQSQF